MGIIERLADEYVDVSTSRATVRELLELLVGSILFVLVASGLTAVALGRTAALVVGGGLAVAFAITLVSQAYWAVTGRSDYRE
ncbi:hypothetical protein [Halopiger goleimassiliensis]|uniref:hypothetical protein n=1 Tax=Halopiger goleimassiliensis TaxID=1293048 RepID=UPI0006776A27|nr:hypothetical protein [Halopiger goleimassiliensis]